MSIEATDRARETALARLRRQSELLTGARLRVDQLEAERDQLIESGALAGLTDPEMADALGVSKQYVNKRRNKTE